MAQLGKRWLLSRSARPSAEELAAPALVFAPHPDDETLGCGGTIIRKREAGAAVRVVFMTDGERSHVGPPITARHLGAMRRREAVEAAAELGVSAGELHFLGYGDGTLAAVRDEAAARVSELLAQYGPAQVYVPHGLDGPADHEATTEIVLSALRHTGARVSVYEYPVWLWSGYPWVALGGPGARRGRLGHGWRSRHAFLRDLRWAVPVGDVLSRKRRALARYQSQTERMFGREDWKTLYDVANGEWVAHLLGEHEFFAVESTMHVRDDFAREG